MQCNNHLGEFGHLLVLPRPPLANPEWVDVRTYSSLNEVKALLILGMVILGSLGLLS